MMQKTGEFHAQAGMREEDPEEARPYNRRLLLGGMASQVAGATVDNREYELVARIGKWEPTDLSFEGEKLRLDFTLVLLDPLVAEVGEWVKDTPCFGLYFEKDKRRLGEGFGEAAGRLFERGSLGWRRIE